MELEWQVLEGPGFQAAQQGAHPPGSSVLESERHTGARGFVGSSTVDDQFTLQVELGEPGLQFLGLGS